MTWRCRLCSVEWTEIPDDAIEIDLSKRRGARRGALYRFSDGTVHELRKLPSPPIKVEPPVEQIQEVQPPEKLPEPEVVEVPEIEDELAAITSLAAAFNRIRK